MAASSQKMSLRSHQWLSHQVSHFCLAESADTNPQFRESKWWKHFHIWGTVLHRDPKKKKGPFGLYAAAKATSTQWVHTCTGIYSCSYQEKVQAVRVSNLILGRNELMEVASWTKCWMLSSPTLNNCTYVLTFVCCEERTTGGVCCATERRHPAETKGFCLG